MQRSASGRLVTFATAAGPPTRLVSEAAAGAASTGYRVHRMGPAQRDDVLQLWGENFAALRGSTGLQDRYQWLHERNPRGAARTVVASALDSGSLVGCASAFPRMFRVAGHDLLAGVPVDFSVLKEHRTAAAAVGIQRALLAEGSEYHFMCGFPNAAALPVLQRVGYRRFTTVRSWVKPVRANYKIAPYVRVPVLVDLASVGPNAWLRAADRVRLGWQRSTGTVVDRADGRFDTLWATARDRYAVAGERTAAYLNWRYADFPLNRHQFFVLPQTDSAELAGYVAFSVRGNKVFVGDVFALDMNDTAERLLLGFARFVRRSGMDSIFLGYGGTTSFERRLVGLGFIRRPAAERHMVAVRVATTPEQDRIIFDESQWHLFEGEMDI